MNPYGPKLLLLLATLLTFSMAAPCWAVSTRGEAFLDGETIVLGDVFTDVGPLADKVVAPAPGPGQKITYDVSALLQIARAFNLDWRPGSNYERVAITRNSNKLDNTAIKNALLAELEKIVPTKDLDVVLDNQGLEVNRAKNEALDYHFVDTQYDPVKHRVQTKLIVAKAKGTAEVITITARAMPMVNVATLSHSISEGTTLGDADVTWNRVAADKAGADAITDMAMLKNAEARRNLAAQTVLRLRDVRSARLVTKGSLVIMVVETPFMQISAQGRALNDGALGDTVRITNTQSNRVVDAIVTGSSKVSVTPVGLTVADAAPRM